MVSYTPSYVFKVLPTLLSALPLTIMIIALTVFLGSLIGGLLTWAQLSKDSVLVQFAKTYVFILRCTPPIVLLFLVFYGLPKLLDWWLGINLNASSRTIYVVITMTLLFTAYISEVFKSAFLSIPKGQREAGISIGLTEFQTFYRIMLPQAFRVALPNITTAILNLMKDTALAYTIGLIDVMGKGNLLIGQHLGNYSLETYTSVAIIYWGLAILISILSFVIENYLKKERV